MPPIEPICRSRIAEVVRRRRSSDAAATCSLTRRPSRAHRERRVGAAEGGDDVVDEPVGVGGEQDAARPRNVLQRCAVLLGAAERGGRPIVAEPVEVVHVAASSGTSTQRSAAERATNGASSSALGLAPARAARRGCATAAATSAAGARPRAACRPRRRCPSPNGGWTRLTTPAMRSMPCSASWSANQTASSTVSRRGEATSTKRVASDAQQADHVVGPLAEPGLHAGERLEEGDGVGEHVGADDLADRPQERLRRRR